MKKTAAGEEDPGQWVPGPVPDSPGVGPGGGNAGDGGGCPGAAAQLSTGLTAQLPVPQCSAQQVKPQLPATWWVPGALILVLPVLLGSNSMPASM